MPELPEVETIRHQLAARIIGAQVESTLSAHLRFDPAPAQGSVVHSLWRRGKYIIATLDSGLELVLHLGMTGQVYWNTPPRDHVCCEITTSHGVLYFRDPRRFGRVAVVPQGRYESFPTLVLLGPEPLEPSFDPAAAASLLASGTSPVKARLLAQHAFAGAGNYICDEALHRSGIHPAARHLTADQAHGLVCAAVEVMKESLAAGGVSTRDYQHIDGGKGSFAASLLCYGRAGSPCMSCGTTLEKIRVAGRGTTLCLHCQPLQ